MTCVECKREIPEYASYCSFCGAPQRRDLPKKRLMLSTTNRKIAGVCGGIGEYLGVDATVIRLVWVVLSIFPGALAGGVIAYVLAWLIIPRAPEAIGAPTATPMEHTAARL